MCGIVGMVGTRWRGDIESALQSLRPRGPDGSGVATMGGTVLGHRRLAVIDLAGGRQPMASRDGRHTVVYNGEIYNFRELRRELAKLGCSFETRSDTEVLLHGWRTWGEQLLPRLDGIFAFALWEREEERLILARDRIGIKPLVYAAIDGGLVFASTLAPFFVFTGFPRRIDYCALRDYLAVQTVHSPRTLLAQVKQLPPATVLYFERGRLRMRRYWSIAAPEENASSFDERIAAVDAALAASVRRQMVAEVPLGAFLSGGIDSSLMVHYMAEAGVAPLRTFNMAFAGGFDETPAAMAVAKRYDTQHTVIDAPSIDGSAFAGAIAALDQPLADPAYVPTFQLSRVTRASVTVAISGDGGDELFAGYPRYAVTGDRFPDSIGKSLLRGAVRRGLLPASLLRRGLAGDEMMLYRQVELGPFEPSRKALARYLAPEALRACRPEQTLELWTGLVLAQGRGMDTAALMRADLWTYLSEDCLVKTDRASMAHGLEVRVPMLGSPVLDLVLGWKAEAHYDAEGGKALLRALARRHLPPEVWRRPKHGFSVPLQDYFNGPWREPIEEQLARCEKLAPYLDAAAVRALWAAACRGKGSRRLAYTFAVLLLWLSTHPVAA